MGTAARGQSGTIGLVLLIAIIISGIALVGLLGSMAVTDTKQHLDTDRAAKTLTQVDSRMAMVALGGTNRQQVQLEAGESGHYTVEDQQGYLNVTITNTTANDDTTRTVVNRTLGSIVYESKRTTMAYQGGGVWILRDGGSTMLSPPEVHYRNTTLTLPIITVEGSGRQTLSGAISVDKHGDTQHRYPNTTANENWTNPLDDGLVNVTVGSEYYQAWGTYFEQRTSGVVDVDHEAEEVTLTLKVPAGTRQVRNAVAATSASGSFAISGSGSRTDSYTSADGDGYAGDDHSQGDITVSGDIEVGGDTVVYGDVVTGGSFGFNGNSGKVEGNVSYSDALDDKNGVITGWTRNIDGISSETPVTSYVDDALSSIRKSNDNDTDADIDAGEYQSAAGDGELGAGDYYLDRLVLTSDTLELNTTEGNVTIAVDEYLRMENDAEIEVTGPNRAKIYVRGEQQFNDKYHVVLENGAPNITTPGQDASKMWLYGPKDMQMQMKANNEPPTIEGVVYAPSGPSGNSTVTLKHAAIYGGVVAGSVNVEQGSEVHFDRALSKRRAVPKDTDVVTITYMHVTVNEVRVSDG